MRRIALIALALLSVPVPYQALLYHSIGPPGAALMTWGLALLWGLMLWRLRGMMPWPEPGNLTERAA